MEQSLIAFFSFALSLLRTMTVLGLAWLTLRQFDRSIGFQFKEWWKKADDKSKAIYLGMRCFAVFFAFSLCMA